MDAARRVVAALVFGGELRLGILRVPRQLPHLPTLTTPLGSTPRSPVHLSCLLGNDLHVLFRLPCPRRRADSGVASPGPSRPQSTKLHGDFGARHGTLFEQQVFNISYRAVRESSDTYTGLVLTSSRLSRRPRPGSLAITRPRQPQRLVACLSTSISSLSNALHFPIELPCSGRHANGSVTSLEPLRPQSTWLHDNFGALHGPHFWQHAFSVLSVRYEGLQCLLRLLKARTDW
jgi:hypothetical protein